MTAIAPSPLSRHVDSYYAASANALRDFPALEGEVDADVCVIGGGYTGLSSALHLAERGYKVVLLEAERVGWGASGRNGGHVGTGQRLDQHSLEAKVGREKARMMWDLSLEAVQTVKDLIEKHQIQCDLKPGILHTAHKASLRDEYLQEAEFLQKNYDYDAIRFVDKDEVRQLVGSDNYHCGTLDSFSCHLHPLNFALGLGRACADAGVRIFENSRVVNYSDGSNPIVTTARGRVKAKFVVLGCNGYLGKLEPRMAGKIMPINNFVLATEPLSDELCRELIRDDTAVADSLFVINYWKLSGDNRLLFGGGENYTSRFPRDMKSFVRKYMLRVYPQLQNTRIDYAWGGTLAITLNRMPHFGRLSDNVFYAQGYSGHGVPTATMAGKLLAEAVAGTAERFDVMADYPTHTFPGGTLLRWPGLVAGMLYYSLRDKL
ncbi:FAD-binding oxidoreductase [Pseudomaricurvus alkylphenolicus]|uniref:NAD(P)/FAD-dependent oxidoreductase n=1 Tax=Pseudomaricurvus alkylphenolicus TaxID=1306991 RepID=UPI0014200ED7|nr:FAD-binding oxidoreductase [Pseudomaricurvus alkylphenolicus]NIB39427.1 FAD-binding oxidoreductase [Pseudomaricurvus alkylphenolicus]